MRIESVDRVDDRQHGQSDAFAGSSSVSVGRILTGLAQHLPSGARVGEAGTGVGAGTAALLRGMPSAATLISVDREAGQVEAAAAALGSDERLTLLTGDLSLLAEHGPFDLLFHDAGPKPAPEWILSLLAPGGTAVIDDFEPSEDPARPMFQGQPDGIRLAYLAHPGLAYEEVRASPEEAAVLLTRIPATSSGWRGRSPRR